MEIETTSYLELIVKNSDEGNNRAEQAYAIAADAIRLHVASTSILDSLIAMLRKDNPAFAEQLTHEIALMRSRIDSIASTLDEIGK